MSRCRRACNVIKQLGRIPPSSFLFYKALLLRNLKVFSDKRDIVKYTVKNAQTANKISQKSHTVSVISPHLIKSFFDITDENAAAARGIITERRI